MPIISNEMLYEDFNELFIYDPMTGILTNKTNRGRLKMGAEAGSLSKFHRNRDVGFRGVRYKSHRIGWLLHHGSIDSSLVIGHINGIKDDNRISNLRLVTQRTNNSDGRGEYPLGVSFNKNTGKLTASIWVDGKNINLGSFPIDHVDEAAQQYKDALKELQL